MGNQEVVGATYLGDENLINEIVQAVEKQICSHPIAQALKLYRLTASLIVLQNLKDLTGKGLEVEYEGNRWKIGKSGFVVETLVKPLSTDLITHIDQAEGTGKTLMSMSAKTIN